VVAALIVAEVKYRAALNVSAVVAARMGAVPKLWVAVMSSPMKLVVIACVFAMMAPYPIAAASAAANAGDFFKVTWTER
jgi:hypothetical protein